MTKYQAQSAAGIINNILDKYINLFFKKTINLIKLYTELYTKLKGHIVM